MKQFFSSLSGGGGTIQPPTGITTVNTIDDAAHCWFSRPRSLSVNGLTVIGTIADFDGSGQKSGVIVIDESDDTFTGYPLRTNVYSDDHDEACVIKRSSDNRLVAAYVTHDTDNLLRYRISTNANDPTAWGNELTKDVGYRLSYPAIYEADNGTLFCFFRGTTVGMKPTTMGWRYVKSTDGGATWGATNDFHLSQTNLAYTIMNQSESNPDRIDLVGNYAIPNYFQNNGTWHGYFDLATETFYNTSGTAASSLPFDFYTDATTFRTITLPADSWIEDVILSVDGKPRAFWYETPDRDPAGAAGAVKNRYYAEFDGSAWTTPTLIHECYNGFIDSVPPITSFMYSNTGRFDDENPDHFYCGKMVNGISEVFRLERISASNWSETQLTFNSSVDQWRVNTIRGSKYKCYWLSKTSYLDFYDYDNTVVLGEV